MLRDRRASQRRGSLGGNRPRGPQDDAQSPVRFVWVGEISQPVRLDDTAGVEFVGPTANPYAHMRRFDIATLRRATTHSRLSSWRQCSSGRLSLRLPSVE
jgi:hypothetical protein